MDGKEKSLIVTISLFLGPFDIFKVGQIPQTW
jgi:hypothetical protein